MDNKIRSKLKQQERIMLFNVILFVFVGFVYYFLIKSGLEKLDTMNRDIDSELSVLVALEKKGHSVDGLKQSLGSTEAAVAGIYESFVEDEVAFVTSLEKMAAKFDLAQQLGIGEAKPLGDFKKVVIDIRTQGNFDDQLSFISALKNSNYYFDIKSLEFSPGTDQGKVSGGSNLHLKIDTYWHGNKK
jgi:hypothetical protein